jgi:hypothetical protein
MKYFLMAFISIAVLLASVSIEAQSIDKEEEVRAVHPRRISKTIASPVIKKQPLKAADVSVEISGHAHRPRIKEATIKPKPVLIRQGHIRQACFAGDLQIGEALQLFKEYHDDSEYKRRHQISGIRITTDRETRENVYQVDLCPMVRYNDNDGFEIEASFFVDMAGEIFILERQIN